MAYKKKNIVLRDLIQLRDRLSKLEMPIEAGFLSSVVSTVHNDLADK